MELQKPSGPTRPLDSSLVVHPRRGPLAPFGGSWRTVMTKETNGAGPDLIVLGRDEAGKPKAARFPSGHDSVVAKAAKAMNLAVCKADGEILVSWRRSYRLAGCTRPGAVSCHRLGKASTARLSSNSSSPVSRCQARPSSRRLVGLAPISLPRGCQPPGTTLPSATW
jgi:hypothetical protein